MDYAIQYKFDSNPIIVNLNSCKNMVWTVLVDRIKFLLVHIDNNQIFFYPNAPFCITQ